MLRNSSGHNTIIVEGVDGMGKSYLTSQLSYELKRDVMTCGPAPKDFDEIKYWVHEQERNVIEGDEILDRVTAFSHYVYTTTFGKTIYKDFLLYCAKRLASYDAIVILCKTDTPTHELKDYDDPEKVKVIMENVDKLHAAYLDLFEDIGVEPIIYDWKAPDAFANLLKKLKDIK
jgi:hypothetical protein